MNLDNWLQIVVVKGKFFPVLNYALCQKVMWGIGVRAQPLLTSALDGDELIVVVINIIAINRVIDLLVFKSLFYLQMFSSQSPF
jgi:hypothetical protein